jgi:hypothetical protein
MHLKPATWGAMNKRMTRYEAAGNMNSGEALFTEKANRGSLSERRSICFTHPLELDMSHTKTGPAVHPPPTP